MTIKELLEFLKDKPDHLEVQITIVNPQYSIALVEPKVEEEIKDAEIVEEVKAEVAEEAKTE
jgi:hypothetical protein